MVLSYPAKLGNAFYVLPQGKKKPPVLTRAELPTNRGAKIAWALSFIGGEKCMASETDFYKKYDQLLKEDSIRNIAVFSKYTRYALVIADKHVTTIDPERTKVKKNNPVLAWIADDITLDELNAILDYYDSHKKLPCPKEFFYLM